MTEDEIFQESVKYEHSTSTEVRTCDGYFVGWQVNQSAT